MNITLMYLLQRSIIRLGDSLYISNVVEDDNVILIYAPELTYRKFSHISEISQNIIDKLRINAYNMYKKIWLYIRL